MTSTPLWVPLVVAGMGVAGSAAAGVAGVVFTQRRADRREQQAWDRERDREREQRAREDAARTFEQRRDAYVDFYTSANVLAQRAYDISSAGDDSLELNWSAEAFHHLQRLEFYADRELSAVAQKTYRAIVEWAVKAEHNHPEDVAIQTLHRRYERAEDKMLRLMRDRLSIPEGTIELSPLKYLKDEGRRVVESD